MKLGQCKICKWAGRTHIHHIIPKRHHGENSKNNLIELCLNHHSEASEDEYLFMKKHNLKGEKFSEKKEKDLRDGAQLFFGQKNLTNTELKNIIRIMEEHDLDKIDFIAYMMGITRTSIEQNYVEGNITKKISIKDKQNLKQLNEEMVT